MYLTLGETDLAHEVVYGPVSHTTRLLEAVKRALDLANMIQAIGVDEALEMLHVDFFGELAVEERRLDIHLMKLNQALRRETQDDPDRREISASANVSSQSTPYFCRNSFATSRALYLSMKPWAVFVSLNTHLLLVFCILRDDGAIFHVSFWLSDPNPESHAFFHLRASLDSIADTNDVGNPPLNTRREHNLVRLPFRLFLLRSQKYRWRVVE